MKLDLTRPTLVILGAWNPAIFHPGWCARVLFDIPEGQSVRTANVLLGPPPKEIVFFGDVGICVSGERLEFYANNGDASTFAEIEKLALRILEVLPHTPLGAVGFNFLFVEDDLDDALVDSFETKDELSKNYKISGREIRVGIEVPSGTLNFSRALLGTAAQFNFNYHISDIKSLDPIDLLVGMIQDNFSHATKLLHGIFGLDYAGDILPHNLPAIAD